MNVNMKIGANFMGLIKKLKLIRVNNILGIVVGCFSVKDKRETLGSRIAIA